MEYNGITETFQLGFKPWHRTESALLRVFDSLFLTTDFFAALLLFDLKAAFDKIDHNILLSWLRHKLVLLAWFCNGSGHIYQAELSC